MKRKNEISEVKADVSLMSICQLVRDLSARQTQTKLSTSEQRVLERLHRQLLQEWSLCMHIEVDEARQMLDQLLQRHVAAV
jgi:RNA polymerase-interacting CarD/CdnL/TRCF family regulator